MIGTTAVATVGCVEEAANVMFNVVAELVALNSAHHPCVKEVDLDLAVEVPDVVKSKFPPDIFIPSRNSLMTWLYTPPKLGVTNTT